MQSECTVLYCYLWHFPTFSHKWHDFWGKKFIEHKMLVLIFSAILCEIVCILRRNEREIIINVRRSSCVTPFIFVRF